MDDSVTMQIIEELGYTDTNDGLINRVAYKLAESGSDIINNDEFIEACSKCHVDPYSFTQSDLEKLQQKLNEIT